MIETVGILIDTHQPARERSGISPVKTLAILVAGIFFAELISMLLLYYVDILNYAVKSVLDGMIMVLLISPALFYLQLKPLLKEIGERSRAEVSLRTTARLLRNILELLPVGVFVTDKYGKIMLGNKASQSIWGDIRYVGIDKYNQYKAWWPESGRLVEATEWAGTKVIQCGETCLDQEVEIEAFDGARKIILNSAVPLLDDEGAIQGAIIVNQDITSRRESEMELARTSELMDRYFHSTHTLIAYLDRNFNFIRVNETYARVGGYPIEYYTGKNHFDLYPHAENQAIFSNTIANGEPIYVLEKPFEYPEFPERGVTYWDWSLQPVKDRRGEVEGLVLSLVDVTERKQAEIQLARQNEELKALSIAESRQRELAESLATAMLVLGTSLELDKVLCAILEQVRKTIPFSGAGIYLIEAHAIHLAGHLGYESYPSVIRELEQIHSINDYPAIREAWSSLKPVAKSYLSDPEHCPLCSPEWECSTLVAPLMVEGNVMGVIVLHRDLPSFFNAEDSDRLIAFTAPAALAIHNAQLYEAQSTSRRLSETLAESARALTLGLSLEHVIKTLLDYIPAIVPADCAGVTLFTDEARPETSVRRGYGSLETTGELPNFLADRFDQQIIHKLRTNRRPEIFPETFPDAAQRDLVARAEGFSWLIGPLFASDKLIGYVEVGAGMGLVFAPDRIRWFEALVGEAGVAIQNAWLFEELHSSKEMLLLLARKLVDVQETERAHISRELHDEAGQALVSLKLSMGRLEQDSSCPERIRRRLADLKGIAEQVIIDLQRLAMDLRPASLDRLGLVPALKQYASKLNSEQLTVQFSSHGWGEERLSPRFETYIYRIVQEALTNVIRHAQANYIGIILERNLGTIKVIIEDNGIGFDPKNVAPEDHLGLVGMRERAEMLGGSITIESVPGRGTEIILEVPDGG